jgi:protein-S-isoprenylcysteine O-methyltransferase Ste14
MEKTTVKMDIMGVGPKIGAIAIPIFILTVILTLLNRRMFCLPIVLPTILLAEGAMMVIIGLIINFSSAIQMIKAVKANKLLTTGFFQVCRNPMYASFIYLTIPGIALLFNSWLILVNSLIIVITFQLVISAEEKILEETFGDAYRKYKARVHRIVPYLKPKKL